METGQVRDFAVGIEDSAIEDLRRRLAHARLPEKETVEDWDQGIPLAYVEELRAYWRDEYDMRRVETVLGQWPNHLIAIDGLDIHFLHIRSPEAGATPLIMTHGWPGSVLEFADVIGPLTDPVAHGGKAEDAFHLVLPSLPGYGFSGKPQAPGWSVLKIAMAWRALMAALGYGQFYAQGGDWGSAVTIAIGALAGENIDGDPCRGIHSNMVWVTPPDEVMANPTEEEQAGLDRIAWYRTKDHGYSTQQSTRPQTLGYALADSPVGQMAWIVEKFHGWSDCGGHPENVYSRDRLLDNVMLYWLTNSAASSARLYWESFNSGEMPQIHMPMGGSIFPKDILTPSRRWAEKTFRNIVYWNRLEQGGHFAAMERAELFVEELRAWQRAATG